LEVDGAAVERLQFSLDKRVSGQEDLASADIARNWGNIPQFSGRQSAARPTIAPNLSVRESSVQWLG
jgi:hypothetical protein